ncbi:unnamed protein product [Gongylonema pulchrum]|uniref:FLYWCH-type domain-containing protein n=1 Tax=Gongylonema pulchrum TaxID=637853 RepID=A0A183D1N1_9BILA|nr:unnamed protein product [Gongylonema pulchrum]
MDLLAQLTGIVKPKEEANSDESNLIIALNSNEQDGIVEESEGNKVNDRVSTKQNFICGQKGRDSGELPRNGIVEMYMRKVPNSGVQIFRSKKGFEKLAYDGYLYNLDKRHQKYVLWRCEMSKKPGYKCSGRVRMTEDFLDTYSPHSHPPNPVKVVADILKARLYAAAEDPTSSSKFLYHEAVHLASFAGSSGLPKLGSMQRVISRKRRHTQKLLEESLSPSNCDLSNEPSTSSAPGETNCSITDFLQTAERLQFLFTPSTGKMQHHDDNIVHFVVTEHCFFRSH